jgi:excisionase family DNA binding protein
MSTGDILTKRDVAELLQVSERTVERWMSEGSIPYVPLPKRGLWSEARFLRTEIVDWMRKRTVRPIRMTRGVASNAQGA